MEKKNKSNGTERNTAECISPIYLIWRKVEEQLCEWQWTEWERNNMLCVYVLFPFFVLVLGLFSLFSFLQFFFLYTVVGTPILVSFLAWIAFFAARTHMHIFVVEKSGQKEGMKPISLGFYSFRWWRLLEKMRRSLWVFSVNTCGYSYSIQFRPGGLLFYVLLLQIYHLCRVLLFYLSKWKTYIFLSWLTTIVYLNERAIGFLFAQTDTPFWLGITIRF